MRLAREGLPCTYPALLASVSIVTSLDVAVLPGAGGLEKLADIVSPSGEDQSVQEVAVGSLQRGLQGIQAALENKQAAVFGEQVSLFRRAQQYGMHLLCS